nr:PQQ-like beta-propeller repeat protein [Pararhodobacter sp. SW119]
MGILGALAGCSRDFILPGERVDIRAPWGGGSAVVNEARPISLPAQVANAAWTHRQGENGSRPQHPALSPSPQLAWSAPIGQGDARRTRLQTDPVAAGGRIFTLDAAARVQATASNGAVLWARDLTPAGQRPTSASGGGLAVAGDRLYVTSAYGFLAVLDATTGAEMWRQQFDAPVTGAPAVAGDRVFVSISDSTLWAIDTANGRVDWSIAGARSASLLARGPAPAISGDLAIMPTGAGELLGVRRATGAIVWDTAVVGRRAGAAYAEISAISGDPVVAGGRVFAANQSGRVMALDARTGTRDWSAREAAYGPVWPIGNSVFLVSDENRLMRLDASDGSAIWAVELPLYTTERPRRRAEIYPQHGPVLAGGRFWIASGDGMLRGFDPVSGGEVTRLEIPGGAAAAPIVADRTLYVLGRNGVLHAFR